MNDSAIDTVHTKEDLWVSHTKKAFSSMTAEGIIGMGAVAATIIGLSNVAPELLASIACIAVGVALAFEGGAISARYSALHGMAEGNTNTDATARWGVDDDPIFGRCGWNRSGHFVSTGNRFDDSASCGRYRFRVRADLG